MKLGTQTGSLVNHLMSRANPVEPELGMGATLLSWTDRHGATVEMVDSVRRLIMVREDKATMVSGNMFSEGQKWEHQPDPNGSLHVFRQDPKTKQWRKVRMNSETGRWVLTDGMGLLLGRRETYRDPSF